MKSLKFYPVSLCGTFGYAVVQIGKMYLVVFGEKTPDGFVKSGISTSRGRTHSYNSIFNADYAIRREILPLYMEAA